MSIGSSFRLNQGRFACTCCGECCTGSQEVRLNPDDLTLILDWLNRQCTDPPRSIGALLASHWISPPRDGDPRPLIRFRTRPLRQCPFLRNSVDDTGGVRGLCALHPDHKPLVCHLAPLAREVEGRGEGRGETWFLTPPVEGCPGFGQGPLVMAGPLPDLVERLAREAAWMEGQCPHVC